MAVVLNLQKDDGDVVFAVRHSGDGFNYLDRFLLGGAIFDENNREIIAVWTGHCPNSGIAEFDDLFSERFFGSEDMLEPSPRQNQRAIRAK